VRGLVALFLFVVSAFVRDVDDSIDLEPGAATCDTRHVMGLTPGGRA
jgi:hypothetical protein